MKLGNWTKVTGWSGIVFVILFLSAELSFFDTPLLDAPASEVRSFFEANSTKLPVAYWSITISVGFLFLLFASGLRSLFGSVETDDAGVWARLSFAGAVVLAAIAGAHSGYWWVLSQQDILDRASDDVLVVIAAFETIMLTTVIFSSVAVFLIGSSVAILRSGVMAKWLGWFGLGSAGLLLLGPLWSVGGVPEGFFGSLGLSGLVGWMVWTIGASISLLRYRRPVSTPLPNRRESSELRTST